MGPTELVQTVRIAREYYLADRSKVEIAKDLGLSRYKVARILDAARAAGVVRIEIGSGSLIDAELSEQVRRHLGLAHCLVVDVDAGADSDAMRQAIGETAAGLLTELVTEDDLLGIAWGRTIAAAAVSLSSLARCQVVQLTGITGRLGQTSMDVLRRVADVSGGTAFPIYAPLVMPERATTLAIQKHPTVQAAMSRFRRVTTAVVAVGSWDAEGSQLYTSLTRAEIERLADLPIAAEVCAMLIDAEGEVLHTGLDGRPVAIGYAELRCIPEIIAVAGGAQKASAIHAVVRAGITTSLVTDGAAARRLLELEPVERRREIPRY